jgi:hypothetical protein
MEISRVDVVDQPTTRQLNLTISRMRVGGLPGWSAIAKLFRYATHIRPLGGPLPTCRPGYIRLHLHSSDFIERSIDWSLARRPPTEDAPSHLLGRGAAKNRNSLTEKTNTTIEPSPISAFGNQSIGDNSAVFPSGPRRSPSAVP